MLMDDYVARLDDAVHEINLRWGEPIGGDDPIDIAEMDQALVRDTAEAVIAPWRAEVERLREANRHYKVALELIEAHGYGDSVRWAREALINAQEKDR